MTRIHQWLRIVALACGAVAVVSCAGDEVSALRTVSGLAQGTTYSLQWSGGGTEREIAAAAADELERIDALLSNYRPDSTLEQFNAARRDDPIELPAELVSLFGVARRIHDASGGCFDPTVRPLVRAWGFDGDTPAVPSPAAIDAARAIVGMEKLELIDATHVRKARPGLEVDMASIGQGYTAGRLAALLERFGSTNYLAEIGGEIVARGTKPGTVRWRVGLENPVPGQAAGPALQMPADAPTAVITSGSYRHYLQSGERRFGHIIDPRTGLAAEHGLLSVTVVGRDATTTAAWGTALLCLGPSAAAATARRENLAAVMWIADGAASAKLELSPAFDTEWRGLLEQTTSR